MAVTRRRSRSIASRRRSYRRHSKSSHCKGKGPAACRGTAGCKYASGRKRSYCRKGRGRSVKSRRAIAKRSGMLGMGMF